MPKGQAAVNWTAEEDAKLFLTVLAVQGIQVDYAAVAKEFGPDVPGSCIQSRMKALRKKAAGLGITPHQSPITGSKRALVAASGTPSKKAKLNGKTKDIDEGASQDFTPPASSKNDGTAKPDRKVNAPKSTIPKPKTARVWPRKTIKNDYKAIGDPLVSMDHATDSNEEKVFSDQKSESEGSHDDDDFEGEVIKTEEDVAI